MVVGGGLERNNRSVITRAPAPPACFNLPNGAPLSSGRKRPFNGDTLTADCRSLHDHREGPGGGA